MKKLRRIAIIIFALCLAMLAGCGGSNTPQGNIRTITELQPGDTYAVMKFRDFEGELTFILFDDVAPVGVEEFTAAANNGYYDGKNFHRILQDMLIQGGALNLDGTDSTIPLEQKFDIETHDNARNFFGALCFSPEPKTGLNYRQFHIVTANSPVNIDAEVEKFQNTIDEADTDIVPDSEMKEHRENLKQLTRLSDEVKERYLEQGGLYLLDGEVTVFGQLITGWDLLEEISSIAVVAGNSIDDENPNLGGGHGRNSRPAEGVFIETIRIIHIPVMDEEEEDE
jgi:cyclophilin family peptidyl-prolyl cis-trans isomerase